MLEKLPTLGLGASLSLSAQPDPVTIAQQTNGPQFIEYAGLVDVSRIQNDIQRIQQANIPVLFHPSFMNFCGSFNNSASWLNIANQHMLEVDSAWFAQDCAYCFWQDGFGYSSQFGYFIPPILNKASLEQAVIRIEEIKAIISRPLAIEPPPVAFTVGTMHVLDFFAELAERTDCFILLDMGHLVSYEMANGQLMSEAIDRFPLERVIELHIAGGRIKTTDSGSTYIDAHDNNIQQEAIAMLDYILPQLPELRAVCYECEGVEEHKVFDVLNMLREKIINTSSSQTLVKKVQE